MNETEKEKGKQNKSFFSIKSFPGFFREREEKISKNVRDVQREKEMEDEIRERKKAEKKAREKEEAYQERLMNWEQREKRKAKDYEKVNFYFTMTFEFPNSKYIYFLKLRYA